tara:strand:+ start:331 stop:435 length:105 start_codon:yes stop_codon:yes gene_type:complete
MIDDGLWQLTARSWSYECMDGMDGNHGLGLGWIL